MAKVAWISDAGRTTGFSRATHSIADRLVEDYGHEIDVLAIGWEAAEPYDGPLRLWRSEAGSARNYLGFDRVVPFLMKVQPDVVFTLEDPGILIRRLSANPYDQQQVLKRFRPILSYLPVDGYNMPPLFQELSDLTTVIAMSRHGQQAFPGSELVYHGVDPKIFFEVSPEHPLTLSTGTVVTSKAECKEAFSMSADEFVVGRIDTNSGRKDWGRQWAVMDEYFATTGALPETVTFWHTRKSPPNGTNLPALLSRSSRGRYIISDRSDWPIEDIVGLQNAFDVVLTTSRGEGCGLGNIEAMACGVPVIATDCSAITEYVGPGGILIPAKTFWTNPYGVDLYLADTTRMARALVKLARDPALRARLGRAAKEHVLSNYNWDVETNKVHRLIEAFTGASTAE